MRDCQGGKKCAPVRIHNSPQYTTASTACPAPLPASCQPPACAEYCSNGSLFDVLEEAKESPQEAARLSWSRRLDMALDAARGIL